MSLQNSIALVTGASAGIGAACARKLAAAGVRSILVARRARRLEQLSQEIAETYGIKSLVTTLDIADQGAVAERLGNLPEEWGAVDILVNNAGLARGMDSLHKNDPVGWNEVLDVNVKGLLAVTQAILPGMLERNRGHVINLGSIAGYEAYPGGAVYCASKFAVRALTRGLKMDLQGTPIRVTSIDPGLVETEFSQVRFRGDQEAASRPYAGMEPLTAEDIAEAVVWAASRPAHVNVMSMTLFPTAQASSLLVHRD